MANWLKWWNYASFWKFFGVTFGTVIVCFLCGFFIPDPWCIIPIGIFCIGGGLLMRKFIPDVLQDLAKEMGLNEETHHHHEEEKAE